MIYYYDLKYLSFRTRNRKLKNNIEFQFNINKIDLSVFLQIFITHLPYQYLLILDKSISKIYTPMISILLFTQNFNSSEVKKHFLVLRKLIRIKPDHRYLKYKVLFQLKPQTLWGLQLLFSLLSVCCICLLYLNLSCIFVHQTFSLRSLTKFKISEKKVIKIDFHTNLMQLSSLL
ncbi:hypothetical protein pb186bvf_003773 [Paramecium bursaria]